MIQLIGGALGAGLCGAAGAMGIASARVENVSPARGADDLATRPISRRMIVTVGATLATLALLGPLAAVLAAVVSLFVDRIGRMRRRARLTVVMGEQLIDAVTGLGAALRAGLSLERAIRFLTDEAQAPLGTSLGALIGDIDVGVPMDQALERWALDVGTADARLLAGVLRLDRRSGGDLPRILDQVAATLRERREAEDEVRALTAQARLSGLILGLLPIGFFLFLLLTSTKDVSAALHTPIGLGAVFLGALLEVVAFLWIRHLLEVR